MRLADSQESVEPLQPSEKESRSVKEEKRMNSVPSCLIAQVRVFPPFTWRGEGALGAGRQHRAAGERGLVDAALAAASSEEKPLPPSVLAPQEGKK